VTLADLLARLDDVEEGPDGYLVHCPAHADSQQSLRLAVSDAGKVLVRCRAGCKTPDVVKGLGLTMRDLATMKPGELAVPTAKSTDVPADAADVARLAVQLDRYAADLDAEPSVLAYAEERFGVSRDDAVRLGLGVATDLGGGPRLVVPFKDRAGIPRGFQARALEKDAAVRWLGPKSPDGRSWSKIGYLPGATGWDEVVVTEGPGDGLTACAVGYDVIFVRGAGLVGNPAAVDEIVAALDGRHAVIAGDGDVAGRRFSATLAEVLTSRGLPASILRVPDGQDVTSWREGAPARFPGAFIKAVQEAEPVAAQGAALLAWDESTYSLTDLGGARFLRDFIESRGSGVRYSEELGFFLLEGGVWRQDKTQAVRTHAQAVADLVRELAAAAAETFATTQQPGDKARAARFGRYAAHAQTSKGLDAMLRELQAVEGVPARPDDFDRHPDLLACRNGVVNLRTGCLGPHDAKLLLTRRVELDYDPAARAPRWEAFLEEVFPAYPDLPAFMRRMVGYGITGHTVEQCFAVLWGKGANGKSVFTDTLTEVFRELTVTTPFSTFEDRPSGGIPNDLAALKGARLVMAAEGEAGKRMAEAVLKRVTGRDLIAARFMRKEFFEFRPTFLLMLATNAKPDFRGQDEGLWRRVKFIPWERFFAPHERDGRLGERLLAESAGILAWAVRGAGEWYANGLQEPATIVGSTKEYRDTSDALSGFLPGVWTKDPASGGSVVGADLFRSYLEWADEENLPDREKWTRRTFFSALEERGLTKRKAKQGVVFDGIRRARRTDDEPDHAAPQSPLATNPTPGAHLPPDSTPDRPTLSGADLDSAL
jgi:putative DNA primase/helicase